MTFCINVVPIIFILGGCFASGEIYVTDEDFKETIASYRSMPARFGHSLPDDGLKGRAVISYPQNACRPIQSPPNDPHAEDPATKSWIVVIR